MKSRCSFEPGFRIDNLMLFAMVLFLFLFTGCAVRQPDSDLRSEKPVPAEKLEPIANDVTSMMSTENADSHVYLVCEKDNRSVTIDAEIVSFFPENGSVISLEEKTEIIDQLRPVLLPPESGVVQPLESGIGVFGPNGDLRAYLTHAGIMTTFENYEIGKQGDLVEPEHLFRYNVFTNTIPGDISFDSEEAANKISRFFVENSIFTYLPYKTLAANDQMTGYYTVYLRSIYDGIPVCISSNDGHSIGVHASISNDGMFYFQGAFAFSETGKRSNENTVSINSILTDFPDAFFRLAPEGNIQIHQISYEYILCNIGAGLYELRPAWCFYGTSETGEGACTDLVFKYDAASDIPWSVNVLM